MALQAHDALFNHMCSSEDIQLAFCELARCRAVCRTWHEAVQKFLPTLHVLDFHGHEESVAGTDVLRSIALVAGITLHTLDLRSCRRLTCADFQEILPVLRVSCRSVTTLDVTGCQDEVQFGAAAVGAGLHFGCASPRALFEHLTKGPSHCPWADLCAILLPRLRLDPYITPLPDAILPAAEHASAWDVALLLSVSFKVAGQNRPRTFSCNWYEEDANRRRLIHFAVERGNDAMLAVLVSARADLNAKDLPGNTPLLSCIEAGHTALAQILIEAGSDVSAANMQGTPPLLACIAAGYLPLAQMLVAKGANVTTTRRDGADLLSLAIVSQNEEVVKFAFKHGPRRFEGQGTANSADDVAQLAQCFLDPQNIGAWLHGGTSPSGLIGEIGAVLSSAAVDQPVRDQLDSVRAFIDHHIPSLINHHIPLLRNPSGWSVAYFVEQLASREHASTFVPMKQQTCGSLEKTPAETAIVMRVNEPQGLHSRPCRLTIMSPHGQVRAVVLSPDGSRLATTQGTMVVVCDAHTGLVVSALKGHLKG